MAKANGWWALVVKTTDDSFPELSEDDLRHIGKLIREGYTEGEVIKDEEKDAGDHD